MTTLGYYMPTTYANWLVDPRFAPYHEHSGPAKATGGEKLFALLLQRAEARLKSVERLIDGGDYLLARSPACLHHSMGSLVYDAKQGCVVDTRRKKPVLFTHLSALGAIGVAALELVAEESSVALAENFPLDAGWLMVMAQQLIASALGLNEGEPVRLTATEKALSNTELAKTFQRARGLLRRCVLYDLASCGYRWIFRDSLPAVQKEIDRHYPTAVG